MPQIKSLPSCSLHFAFRNYWPTLLQWYINTFHFYVSYMIQVLIILLACNIVNFPWRWISKNLDAEMSLYFRRALQITVTFSFVVRHTTLKLKISFIWRDSCKQCFKCGIWRRRKHIASQLPTSMAGVQLEMVTKLMNSLYERSTD